MNITKCPLVAVCIIITHMALMCVMMCFSKFSITNSLQQVKISTTEFIQDPGLKFRYYLRLI